MLAAKRPRAGREAELDEGGFRGGCLCGRVRYVCANRPVDAGYCHCRTCQRAGAPVLAWGSFDSDDFRYEKEPPAVYRSSPHAQREFCPSCGTQLVFREDGGRTVDVNLGSLDDPASVQPEYHIWTDSRIAWFDTADGLPRYPDGGPDAAPS